MPGFAEFKQPANIVVAIFSNQYPRKGPRQLVEKLFVVAKQPPTSNNKTQALLALEQARAKLQAKANDDPQRLKSINDAEPFFDQAADLLKNEPKGQSQQQGQVPELQGLTSQEEQKKAELAMALKLLGQRIAGANRSSGKNQAVLPDRKEIEPSVLLGRAATLQLSLNSAVKGTDFDKIRQEIDTLDKRVQNLEAFITQGRQLVDTITADDGVMVLALRALRSVASDPAMQGIDYKKTKLAGMAGALSSATGGRTVIPAAIEKMAKELEQELQLFNKNPAAYAGATAKAIKDAEALENAHNLFDGAIDPRMEKLRLVAEPLDDPALGTAAKQRVEYRGKIPGILASLGHAPNAGEVTNGLTGILDQAIQQVSGKADLLEQEVRQARVALMTDADANNGTLKATRDMPAFAADWKQIDAALIGLQKMVPMGMALEGQALYDLLAAKHLCEQAKGLVDALRSTQGSVGTFDADLSTLEQDIATAKGKDAPLTKYDEASIKGVEAQFTRFKKAQPEMLAAAAQKTLAEIRKTFDAKKQAADEVANAVSSVEPDYTKWTGWAVASAKGNEGVKEAVNCLYEALKPLKAAMEAKPAVKADIERTHAEAARVFGTLNDEGAAIQLARTSKAGLEQKARQTEEQAELLRQRLKVLKERLPVAKTQVQQAKGDPNQIKAIEDLIKQAGDEIDASPDAAARTLNRIEQRIDLVYANPAGGVARSRQQLPDVLSAWKSARRTARDGLQAVIAALGDYEAPNEPARQAVTKLGDTITEYMMTFTGGGDTLDAPIKILADPGTPDPARRKAREEVMAEILDKLRVLQAHPLTAQLAGAPFPGARAAPRRLIDTLDWLHYTILTSVQ